VLAGDGWGKLQAAVQKGFKHARVAVHQSSEERRMEAAARRVPLQQRRQRQALAPDQATA
jgi:hypothetical protein